MIKVIEPWSLHKAKLIDRLCQRYSCLPSQLLNEDASLLRSLNILSEAGELQSASEDGTKSNNGAGDIEASLANVSF